MEFLKFLGIILATLLAIIGTVYVTRREHAGRERLTKAGKSLVVLQLVVLCLGIWTLTAESNHQYRKDVIASQVQRERDAALARESAGLDALKGFLILDISLTTPQQAHLLKMVKTKNPDHWFTLQTDSKIIESLPNFAGTKSAFEDLTAFRMAFTNPESGRIEDVGPFLNLLPYTVFEEASKITVEAGEGKQTELIMPSEDRTYFRFRKADGALQFVFLVQQGRFEADFAERPLPKDLTGKMMLILFPVTPQVVTLKRFLLVDARNRFIYSKNWMICEMTVEGRSQNECVGFSSVGGVGEEWHTDASALAELDRVRKGIDTLLPRDSGRGWIVGDPTELTSFDD